MNTPQDEQQPGGDSGQCRSEERGQAEQSQGTIELEVGETGDLCLEEQRAEHQSLPGDIDAENIASASISSRHTQQTRQPLAILRAVARYVDRPDNINNVQILTDNMPGTSQLEGMSQAEQPCGEICHTGHTSYGIDRAEHQPGGNNSQSRTDGRGQAEQCQDTDGVEDTTASTDTSSSKTHHTRQPLAKLRAVARYVDCPVNNKYVQKLTSNILGPIPGTTEQAEPKPGQGDIPVPPQKQGGQPEQLPMDSSRAEHQPNQAMQLKQAVLSGIGRVEQLPCEKSRDEGQAEQPHVNQAEHQHHQARITEGQAEKDDPYTKAWEEWKLRYETERLEKLKRLAKQEKLETSWGRAVPSSDQAGAN